VAVKGLKVKGGAKKRGQEDRPVEHDVEVHLECYYYVPPADGRKQVLIPNEDLRLEDPGIKAAISSFQPERRGSYALKPATGRRDPFVDVRREVVVEDPEAVRRRFEVEEGVVADLERRHDEIREKAEAEKALFSAGDLFRRDRLAQEVDAAVNELRVRIANVASVKSVTFPDLLARTEKVRVSVEEIASGRRDLPRELTITVPVAEQTGDQIRKAFETGDFAEVISIANAWETFLRGKAVDEAVQPYLEEIKAFKRRAKTLQEFHAKPIHVTGTVVNRSRPADSVALVNGKTVHVGDAIDDRGSVRVVGVQENGVLFSFEDETILVKREDAGRTRDRDGPTFAPASARPPR
jgi:hypothetical protein